MLTFEFSSGARCDSDTDGSRLLLGLAPNSPPRALPDPKSVREAEESWLGYADEPGCETCRLD